MTNNDTKAARWMTHLANCPDVPFRALLKRHFEAARITRACDCGCNSFDFQIPSNAVLEPLCEPGRSGVFFEIHFQSNAGAELAFLCFVDGRGYLSGIDVTLGAANHLPVPDDVEVGPVIYRSDNAV